MRIFSTNQKHPLGKRRCAFCTYKMDHIDYKNTRVLRQFMNGFMKIKPRYYSGVCLSHQKKLSNAIKRARHMAMLPYVVNFK